MNTPEFATLGNDTTTALNESTFGTGQQQRADVRKPFRSFSTFSTRIFSVSSRKPLTLNPERLRRNNLRLPRLLARRSLHIQLPLRLQIPIQRHRRPTRLRRIRLLRPPNAQPRPRFHPCLPNHMGELHHSKRSLNLRTDRQWCKLNV